MTDQCKIEDNFLLNVITKRKVRYSRYTLAVKTIFFYTDIEVRQTISWQSLFEYLTKKLDLNMFFIDFY